MLDINNVLGWNLKTSQRSMLRLQGTQNASPNQCKTWTNVIQKLGNDFVYEKDTVLGDRIKIVKPGVYSIGYTETLGAAGYIGLSLNSDPSVGVTSLPQDQILMCIYEPDANIPRTLTYVGVLKAGDILRCQGTSAIGSGGNAFSQILVVTKVSD
jgi:hypothetical protein